MRTTMIIPDELYARAKGRAHDDGQTVTSLVEEALRRELQRRDALSKRQAQVELAPASGSGGTLPGVDLTDGASLLDLMDEGQPIEKRR